MSIYEYKNTYTIDPSSQQYASLLKTTNTGSKEYCVNQARLNNSPFFLLNDVSNCYIYNQSSTTNNLLPSTWVNSLTDCSAIDCYTEDTTNLYNYGTGQNNYSLYSISTDLYTSYNNASTEYTTTFKGDFDKIYIDLLDNLTSLENQYKTYRDMWYDYVDISNNEQIINSSISADTRSSYDQALEQYTDTKLKVQNDLVALLEKRILLENKLAQLNGDTTIQINELSILDAKIQTTKANLDKYMGESSGAIGMLKDNKYKSAVLITENTAMSLIIIGLIYYYFRHR